MLGDALPQPVQWLFFVVEQELYTEGRRSTEDALSRVSSVSQSVFSGACFSWSLVPLHMSSSIGPRAECRRLRSASPHSRSFRHQELEFQAPSFMSLLHRRHPPRLSNTYSHFPLSCRNPVYALLSLAPGKDATRLVCPTKLTKVHRSVSGIIAAIEFKKKLGIEVDVCLLAGSVSG